MIPMTIIAKNLRSNECCVSVELPVILAKAVELFIAELAIRAFVASRSEDPKAKRIYVNDLTSGISGLERFDFLRDILVEDELPSILKSHRTDNFKKI